MGGCASKPKESDLRPHALPSEAPAGSPKEAEAEAEPQIVAQDNNKGVVETHKEEPLVDLSGPQQKRGDSESKTADAEVVAQPDVIAILPTENPADKQAEDHAEAAINTTEPNKEEQEVAVTTEANTQKSDAAPTLEYKSDAPLVTV